MYIALQVAGPAFEIKGLYHTSFFKPKGVAISICIQLQSGNFFKTTICTDIYVFIRRITAKISNQTNPISLFHNIVKPVVIN